MINFIKDHKKNYLLLMFLFDVILISCLYVKANREEVMPAFNMKASVAWKEYNQLLVNTYLTRIKEASDYFYEEYYITSPVVDYYSVFVKNIVSDNGTYYVTFTSKPYLGPHDTIGIDEITFSADYRGNIILSCYTQRLSYLLTFISLES